MLVFNGAAPVKAVSFAGAGVAWRVVRVFIGATV